MMSATENSSPSPKDLNAILNSNVAMLNEMLAFVDTLMAKSSGEEDTVALCSLRQHEQFPAMSGLKRLRSQCVAEVAYHERLSSGEVPLDPFVKSTNAAHLSAIYRFLRLCKPGDVAMTSDEHGRVLVGVLQAIHFKQATDGIGSQKPSWTNDDELDGDIDECAYASDGDDSFGGGDFGDVLLEEPENERPPLVVDVQAYSGHVWLKAVARNPRSLLRAARGECEFGEKSMLTYASDYAEASQLRPIHHRNPFTIFFFEFGVESSNDSPDKTTQSASSYPIIAEQLLGAGVLPAIAQKREKSKEADLIIAEAAKKVTICSFCRLSLSDVFEHLLHEAGAVPLLPNEAVGQDLDATTEWLRSRFGEALVAPPSIGLELDPLQSVDIKNGVNLDVSCLLVLVSSLTNGRCGDELFASNRHRALREQAANERKRPVIQDQLGPFFAKRPNLILYCCETALTSFNDIVKILAGPCERLRADALLRRLVIMPDVVSSRVAALPESVNVKPRAKTIFGFGDAYRLVTLTANAAFVRAALYHAGGTLGHQLAIYLHPSRALSEQKEEIIQPGAAASINGDNWVKQLFGEERNC